MFYDRTILGYHGTDRLTADSLLAGEPFRPSTEEWDWLGRGVYFWEYGLDRARRWASEKHGGDGAVVGALIQLGQCYDLMDTRFTVDLRQGAADYVRAMRAAGEPLPRNKGRGRGARYLDCAVINFWLDSFEVYDGMSFQTVRCGFTEGEPVFDGMEILMESHIQVAVRDPSVILGTFRPTPTTR